MSTQTTNSFFLSSLSKKYFMAATGLFLCIFLLGHLAGNLQLFMTGEAGKLQFNEYAKFMTTFPAVKILSYLTYFSIVFHAIDGILLTLKNRKARPVGYAYNRPDKNSNFPARNMAILGSLILVFIVLHLSNFWVTMHWGELDVDIWVDSNGNRDLHSVVMNSFKQLWYVAVYVVCMVAISLHLWHGFQSGFQSLGLNHPRYTPLVKKAGYAFAIVVPALFAAIPVYIYFFG
jgi:succinate dehydrogenase / fumarate reductase, cytochrome b subunit